jgi:hypothetical protein
MIALRALLSRRARFFMAARCGTEEDTEEEMSISLVAPQALGNRGKTISQPAGTKHLSLLVRTREYLTGREIERLMAAARKGSRWGHRGGPFLSGASHSITSSAPGKQRGGDFEAEHLGGL